MANPMYGQNKEDNFQDKNVICVESKDLSSANTQYIAVPWKCKVLKVYWAVSVALTTAKSTITLKSADGTMAGTHEVTASAAIGDSGVFTPTSNNVLGEGALLEIENDAAPGSGLVVWSIVVEAA
jgi:hypothetical protein